MLCNTDIEDEISFCPLNSTRETACVELPIINKINVLDQYKGILNVIKCLIVAEIWGNMSMSS